MFHLSQYVFESLCMMLSTAVPLLSFKLMRTSQRTVALGHPHSTVGAGTPGGILGPS